MECIAEPFLWLVLWIQKKREFISVLRSLCVRVCVSVCVLAADSSTAAHGGAAAEA